jgi:phosphoribosylaminoimidazole carboxylase
VHPSPATVKLIQDKYNQKVHLRNNYVPVADFVACENAAAVRAAGDQFGYGAIMLLF